jgi:hypothetical protein
MNQQTTTKATVGTVTHEAYIAAIRALAVARVQDAALQQRLLDAKLVYGSGMAGTRGVTFYGAWKNTDEHAFVEICATGEESDVQIAGTTIHELGHVLAGMGTGHSKEWKAACAVLGLNAVEAGGQAYSPEHFDADLWTAISALPVPNDGAPVFQVGQRLPGRLGVVKLRPCPLGIGTRGGKSRGAGSGSRLRLYTCECRNADGAATFKVRIASDSFDATCNVCRSAFKRAEAAPAVEAA